MKKRILFIPLLLLLTIPYSLAATIHGTVYDMELNPAKNAIVKVNTLPEQTYVAKDGTYSFTVPNGKYIIESVYQSNFERYMLQQELEVIEEGDYVLDLILFPDISEEESLLDEDIEIPYPYPKEKSWLWLYILIIIVIAFVGIYLILRKKKPVKKEKIDVKKEIPSCSKEELTENLIDKVLDFIKQNDGRTTQKEIRKQFPLSEAKISLVITELEDKGLVKKIKKGRGNVILLNK